MNIAFIPKILLDVIIRGTKYWKYTSFHLASYGYLSYVALKKSVQSLKRYFKYCFELLC